MATKENEGAAAPKPGNGIQPSLSVLAQYVKDLSFESPGAPATLRSRDKAPNIGINVNVNANPLSETEFALAHTGGRLIFELDGSGNPTAVVFEMGGARNRGVRAR